MSFLREVRLEDEFGPLEEGGISRVQKGRILLSVAATRHDTYCVALDSDALASLGTSDSQIVPQRHCQRTFGFTEEQILECEVVAALNNFANILQNGRNWSPRLPSCKIGCIFLRP
jgi:hypothetical protein